ncbi:MAG: hypothetical protein RAP41_02105 [Candidatus Orphnella occulta]|nr:hypothetical protein [Candidatus Orphnella occulta]
MKKYYIPILFLAIVFIGSPVFAGTEPENSGTVKLSPGMELKQIGTVNRLVPVDMKVVDKDGLVTTESMGEYVARRFIETEKHFNVIENSLAEIEKTLSLMQEEVEQFKGALKALPRELPKNTKETLETPAE